MTLGILQTKLSHSIEDQFEMCMVCTVGHRSKGFSVRVELGYVFDGGCMIEQKGKAEELSIETCNLLVGYCFATAAGKKGLCLLQKRVL